MSQPVGGEGTQGDGAVWQRRGHATGAILTFLLLAFGWSWLVGLAAMHVRDQSAMAGNALLMLSGFGPSLAGLAVVAGIGGRSGLRDWLTRCLRWRIGWHWFALAFALPPVAMLLALALHAALGGTIAASPANGHILLAIVNFALVLVVGGPLGEEFGWRGYLLPAIAARLGWRWAGLVVGVLWGVWHLPLFFIADESVSALDVRVQAQVLALLRDLQARLGLSILFITHDLRVAAQLCDEVAVMRDGVVEEAGPIGAVFADPRSAYTRSLVEAIPGRALFGV